MDLFNLPIQQPIKSKEEKILIIEKPMIKEGNFKEIIKLYKESCNRIIKRVSGDLLVGFEDKTMYFNKQGIHEFDLSSDVGLMPADEIILVNEDREFNDLQLKKLNDMKVTEYIKRKGDSNIIIPGEKTIVINPKGWVIEYEQKPKYHENELFITEMAKEITDSATKSTKMDINITEFEIDDSVEIEYQGIKSKGKVVRIYNNGETINVDWEGKRTAFYYKNVKKIGA
jgi:signal peptidase I